MPFRDQLGPLNAVYRKYKNEAAFFVVYIHEAHPEKSWLQLFRTADPKERAEAAESCVARLNVEIPTLVDTPDDRTMTDYAAWPDRLYVVDTDGRIAFKGGKGPEWFIVSDMKAALETTLRGPQKPNRKAVPVPAPSVWDRVSERTGG